MSTPSVRFLKLVPATRAHCNYIAEHMRQADKDEVMAASGSTPLDALLRGYLMSEISQTALDVAAIPIGMWGVYRETWRWSVPWLLGTKRIEELWLPFLRTTRAMFPEVCRKYPCMHNHVDVRNKQSMAWLKWLGFEMGDPAPYGAQDLPFVLFRREDINHV